uniref:THAP-type domain-containing protein n=1 Tax=Sander lucioperca TaxID=283035 RepID=A0A8C9YWI5_SANLU
MASRKTGIVCAVRGCRNNWYKRKIYLEQECFNHRTRTRAECGCDAPFDLYPPPKNEESLRLWLKALNLKKPPKRPYVCSFHFVNTRPTEDHPIPEKWLGYEVPIKTPRRRVRRLADTDDSHCVEEADQAVPQSESPTHNDADTQWEVQALMDHTYILGQKKNHVWRQRNTIMTLSLSAFFDHVKYLKQFYKANFKMHVMDQILMTMMKLKLNLLQGDLAERFAVSQGLVSRILSYWIDTMEEHMRIYISWLPRETIRSTMPQCIIDCTETTLQKPHNLDSRGESYSHYYSSNTIKYLVAIAPCGLIMFISPAYGGRCSVKFITQESGFLEYLRPGDEVMADRGFTIRDLLFERKVNLVLPAFTHKGGQLSDEDVTATRRISNVRIHVERVIRRLKVFKIISQTVPINLEHKMDKILRICAALVNMQGEIIHEDAD